MFEEENTQSLLTLTRFSKLYQKTKDYATHQFDLQNACIKSNIEALIKYEEDVTPLRWRYICYLIGLCVLKIRMVVESLKICLKNLQYIEIASLIGAVFLLCIVFRDILNIKGDFWKPLTSFFQSNFQSMYHVSCFFFTFSHIFCIFPLNPL